MIKQEIYLWWCYIATFPRIPSKNVQPFGQEEDNGSFQQYTNHSSHKKVVMELEHNIKAKPNAHEHVRNREITLISGWNTQNTNNTRGTVDKCRKMKMVNVNGQCRHNLYSKLVMLNTKLMIMKHQIQYSFFKMDKCSCTKVLHFCMFSQDKIYRIMKNHSCPTLPGVILYIKRLIKTYNGFLRTCWFL